MRHVMYAGLILLAACARSDSALAQSDLTSPEGQVILSVSGAIGVTNEGDFAVFDLAMLESLPVTTFTTTTIWTDGEQEFTGVELGHLVDVLGVDGKTLVAGAINDYEIEIPLTDAVENGPIIAYLRNGETMSVREKGPLWIVYPYDTNPDYRTEVIYSRSIWQLDRIEAR